MTREPGLPARLCAGFTLVELVVVLAILAALATAATLSTEGVVSQSRYDTTRSTLTGVEDAILGRPNLVDSQGRPWVQGFVADIGRLPRITGTPSTTGDPEVDDPINALLLQELWSPPIGVEPFAIQMPTGIPVGEDPSGSIDPEVQLPAGWRGPYLRLPLGASGLRDSWGNPFALESVDGSPLVDGAVLGSVGTLGADKNVGGIDWEADHKIVLASAPIPEARTTGGVTFEVTCDKSPSSEVFVVVRIFGPTDGVIGVLDQKYLQDTGDEDEDGDDQDAKHVAASSSFSFDSTFDKITIGPRALVVYVTTDDPTSLLTNAPVPGVQKRTAVQLTVVPGGIPPVPVPLVFN